MTEIERAISCLRDDFDILTTRIVALERSANVAATATVFSTPGPSFLNQGAPVKTGVANQGHVAMNTWGSLNVKPTGVIGPDSNAKKIMDFKNFIEALLDLDCYGLNVTEEVRNAARKVLGR